jgi:hypothetical protein
MEGPGEVDEWWMGHSSLVIGVIRMTNDKWLMTMPLGH